MTSKKALLDAALATKDPEILRLTREQLSEDVSKQAGERDPSHVRPRTVPYGSHPEWEPW